MGVREDLGLEGLVGFRSQRRGWEFQAERRACTETGERCDMSMKVEMGSYCLMVTGFLFGLMKNFWK